jgi:probable addiction module antidote protein
MRNAEAEAMAKVKVETQDFDPCDYVRDDAEAALYISDAMASGDPAEIAVAIGTVARARGASGLARATGISRAALYKGLSAGGNPTLATVLAVLKELGMTLKVELESKAA